MNLVENEAKRPLKRNPRSTQSPSFNIGDWKTVVVNGIPQQNDSVSCGVFVCAYAYCLYSGMNVTCFSQNDIQDLRKLIAYSIKTQQLAPTFSSPPVVTVVV